MSEVLNTGLKVYWPENDPDFLPIVESGTIKICERVGSKALIEKDRCESGYRVITLEISRLHKSKKSAYIAAVNLCIRKIKQFERQIKKLEKEYGEPILDS